MTFKGHVYLINIIRSDIFLDNNIFNYVRFINYMLRKSFPYLMRSTFSRFLKTSFLCTTTYFMNSTIKMNIDR